MCGPGARIKIRGYTCTGKTVWRCRGNFNKGGSTTRHRLLVTAESVCERCGFVPEHVSQLDVHRHREPDAEIICANCHRLETARERGLIGPDLATL